MTCSARVGKDGHSPQPEPEGVEVDREEHAGREQRKAEEHTVERARGDGAALKSERGIEHTAPWCGKGARALDGPGPRCLAKGHVDAEARTGLRAGD